MKIKIGCGVILVVMLYLSIRIILFSVPDTKKKEKASQRTFDATHSLMITKEEKKEPVDPGLEKFYNQLFLLKGRKIAKSKDFIKNYRIFLKAVFFLKRKNYMGAKRRLEHITSFLDDNYMPDLILKSKCYIMLAEIFEKKEIIAYERKYMDKWYSTYKKLIRHKDAVFYKNMLADRAFLMKKITGVERSGAN